MKTIQPAKAGTIGGYCFTCEEPLYWSWNATRSFVFLLDHMHLTKESGGK